METVCDFIVIIIYFAVVLWIGWRGRGKTAESYWVAGRSYGTSRITMSLVATIFGASSTIGIIGLGYRRGLTGAWWSLIGGLFLIPFGLFFAGRVRGSNAYTLPQILKNAYGDRVSIPAGLMIAVAWCGVIAAQLVAGGRILCGLFSINFQWALFLVAAVFVVYTLLGGQLSVIRTDFWQFFLFGAGLLVAMAFLLFSLYSDHGHWWRFLPPDHLGFPVAPSFGWYDVLVYYPLIVGLPYLAGPDIYSRTLCARDDQVAKRAAINAAAIVIPLSFVLALFGLFARVLFSSIAADEVLPNVLQTCVPVVLRGVVAAGFLSAIMSSADTCLISASTILALDVVSPIRSDERIESLRITKVAVIFLGLVSWLIASQEQGIISSLLLAYTVFVGGIVVPTLVSFFKRELRVTSEAAFWAIVIGGTVAIAGKLYKGILLKSLLTSQGQIFLKSILGPKYLSLLPILLSALTIVGLSILRR